jgi:hypothetical protein
LGFPPESGIQGGMKLCTVTLALLLGLPLAVHAESKVTKTTIHGRPVTVITETTTQAPAACHELFVQQINRRGWHDPIYRQVDGNRAIMIFSQRETGSVLNTTSWFKDVKITLWKAVSKNGKTQTEARIYRLPPSEVNDFLDTELRGIASEFAGAPLSAS